MFIKTTRTKGYEYIKLVESYRDKEGITRHRVLYNFGRADFLRNDESFLRIVKRLCEIADIPVAGDDGTAGDAFHGCGEAELFNYGYLAYLKLWKELGIEDCLREAQGGTKITYPLAGTVFLMALQHLLWPMSKLATYERQNRYFRLRGIPLQHLYRALDVLSEKKEAIEAGLFEHNYVRANKKVDVVFYDVTTVHFESVNADEIRDFGFSKNGRFNEVQVVLGMITDADGMPVGYELFKGNTFDGKTMIRALGNIRKRFGINRVVIVADRGINSKDNLNLIKAAGYGYIMAAKIRGAGAALRGEALSGEGFTDVTDEKGELAFRYKVIGHENIFTDAVGVRHELSENVVVSYSPARAKKDKADRERLVEKANRLLERPGQITASNKRGGRKYIGRTGKAKEEYVLDTGKIEQDAMYDGYYAIQTSEKMMAAADVMAAYHTLWRIEESFRIMKTTLELRPVYHYEKRRIEGHFAVCFLAFLMERKMELLLKGKGDDKASATPDKIREALAGMQLAAVETKGGEMFIKTKTQPLAQRIFKTLKLDIPGNISTEKDLAECFKLDDGTLPRQLTLL